jgi:hypothetical protein
MAKPWPEQYEYWPKQLPFPTAIQRTKGWVPNRLSVDLPWAQFAPNYLPPGSGSIQPFNYPAPGTQRLVPGTYDASGPSYQTSTVGPPGDIAQLPPPYGDPNMAFHHHHAQRNPHYGYRARFNQGEPEAASATVDQLLTTPTEIPAATVVSEVAATEAPAPVIPVGVEGQVVVSPDEAVTAVAVASEAPFTPYPPELLVGLKPVVLERIQRLEANINKLSIATRGPAMEATYQRLLRVHDRVEKALERRLVRRERFKNRGPRAQKMILAYRQKKAAVLQRRFEKKVENIEKVREAYQSGEISGQRAHQLMTAIVRPGVQMPGLAAQQHPIAAEHPLAAKAAAAAVAPRYALFKR